MRLVYCITRKHETFSTFLSEARFRRLCMPCALSPVSDARSTHRQPLDGLQRWQMFFILITLVASQLLVNIWMYYAKVRAMLVDAHLFHQLLTQTLQGGQLLQ